MTHEHVDHVDVLRLLGSGLPVFAPQEANIPGLTTVPVRPDEELEAAGFRVQAVGGRHAAVLEDQETCANLGYLIDALLYHPGDALHIPAAPVETLLVPLQASWLKTSEAIAFVRQIAPSRAHGIHDGQINERALGSINGWTANTPGPTTGGLLRERCSRCRP